MRRLLPCTRPRAVAFGLLLLTLPLSVAGAGLLHADPCTGCPPPTLAMLQGQPGFALTPRPQDGDPGVMVPDHYYLDAGECEVDMAGPPHVTRLRSWLVLRGQGEVWNCPHSKSVDTITVQATQTDSTSWTLTGSVGVKLGTVTEAITVALEAGNTTGVTITEVTTVTKTITPGFCRRIAWRGYFEVAAYKATAEFRFRQRWAWWTKNASTGATVHAKGNVWVVCGTGTLGLGRTAPIRGYFDLDQRGCADSGCGTVVPKHLGFFPPPPPYLEPPTGDPQDPPMTQSAPGEPTTADPDLPTSQGLGDPPTGPLPNPFAQDEDR